MSSTMFHAPYMLHSAIHFLQNNTLFRKSNTSVKYMFWGNILTAHEHITVSCVIVCWNQTSKKSFPYRSPYRTHAFLFSGAFVFLKTIDGVVVLNLNQICSKTLLVKWAFYKCALICTFFMRKLIQRLHNIFSLFSCNIDYF